MSQLQTEQKQPLRWVLVLKCARLLVILLRCHARGFHAPPRPQRPLRPRAPQPRPRLAEGSGATTGAGALDTDTHVADVASLVDVVAGMVAEKGTVVMPNEHMFLRLCSRSKEEASVGALSCLPMQITLLQPLLQQ
jgi:hypothetical protein